MKSVLLILLLLISRFTALACNVCEKQQPRILKGVTHGGGPESNWDYVIVITTAILVICTLFFSIKWLVKPNEQGSDHIKRTVLN